MNKIILSAHVQLAIQSLYTCNFLWAHLDYVNWINLHMSEKCEILKVYTKKFQGINNLIGE